MRRNCCTFDSSTPPTSGEGPGRGRGEGPRGRGAAGPFHNGGRGCLRSHVDSNVSLIKLQKQLADRAGAVTEMEARFLQLQEVSPGSRLGPPGSFCARVVR